MSFEINRCLNFKMGESFTYEIWTIIIWKDMFFNLYYCKKCTVNLFYIIDN